MANSIAPASVWSRAAAGTDTDTDGLGVVDPVALAEGEPLPVDDVEPVGDVDEVGSSSPPLHPAKPSVRAPASAAAYTTVLRDDIKNPLGR
ncbi:hypothetical protein ACOCJ7_02965 [Knoellia sp. CPCC 206453]|uniref:hypothetical protein n=1 Tax=Knoellia pratensis TaxID=3404796 RepID=UPI003620B805